MPYSVKLSPNGLANESVFSVKVLQVQASYGGEDAYFTSPVGGGAFGVADGVGGWQESGINPAGVSSSETAWPSIDRHQHFQSLWYHDCRLICQPSAHPWLRMTISLIWLQLYLPE